MNKTQKYTNARLNAIQALYASELNDIPLEKIVFQFLNGEIGNKIIEEDEFGDDKVRNYYHKSQELIKQTRQGCSTAPR